MTHCCPFLPDQFCDSDICDSVREKDSLRWSWRCHSLWLVTTGPPQLGSSLTSGLSLPLFFTH